MPQVGYEITAGVSREKLSKWWLNIPIFFRRAGALSEIAYLQGIQSLPTHSVGSLQIILFFFFFVMNEGLIR